MISYPKRQAIALLLLALGRNYVADAFAPSLQSSRPLTSTSVEVSAEDVATAAVKERPTTDSKDPNGESSIDTNMSADEAKSALIDLIPRMTGQDEEFRAVESYVNLLETKYSPMQTIDFLNLAMSGEWQLLFSTNVMGSTRKLRLRELIQKIDADGFSGKVTNSAQWEYAEDAEAFDAAGQFSVVCSYSINQGARMVIEVEDHQLRPARGSKIPGDVPKLVGLLSRAIPKEVFDPSGHAMDTTYLDAELRIVRMTGPNHEGVRNIFMRKGSLEINPV